MIIRPPTTKNPGEEQIWKERISRQTTSSSTASEIEERIGVVETLTNSIPGETNYESRLKGLELLLSQISPIQSPDFDKKLKELECLVHSIHEGTRPEVTSQLSILDAISSQLTALISMQSNIPYDNLIARIKELEIKIEMIPMQNNLLPKLESIQNQIAMLDSQQNLKPEIEELRAQIAMLHSNIEKEVIYNDIYS